MGCCQLDELEVISANKQAHFYQKGQTIFQEGSAALGLHCVHKGKIKITKSGGDGKEQIIRLAKDAEVLGFQPLLTQSKYSTSAVALEDCVVCFVPRADFLRMVHSNSQFSTSLMRLLSNALSEAELRMLHMAYKPVRERLAEALLMLKRTFQEVGEAAPFSISFSRDDLASLVGTAKETAIRLLSELKDDGIISTRGSLITILQPQRLVEISSQYD
jgi:CRP-like cAMP-binding protein